MTAREQRFTIASLIVGLVLGLLIATYIASVYISLFLSMGEGGYWVIDLREAWPSFLAFAAGVVVALGSGISLAFVLKSVSSTRSS